MEKNKWEGKIAAFLGDSITHGSSSELRFSDIVGERMGFSEVYNYGHGGSRITLVSPDDFSFVNRYEKMTSAADIVFVMGGTNDYGHGDLEIPFGDFSDRTANTFHGALHVLYQGLIRKYLGKTVIVMTPPHRRGFGSWDDLSLNPKTGKNFSDYVNAIRKTAEYYGLPVLDLYRILPLNPVIPEIREKFMPDGLHPNTEGHLLIAEAIISFLKIL